MKLCKKCYATCTDDMMFCPGCGAPLQAPPSMPQQMSQNAFQQIPQQIPQNMMQGMHELTQPVQMNSAPVANPVQRPVKKEMSKAGKTALNCFLGVLPFVTTEVMMYGIVILAMIASYIGILQSGDREILRSGEEFVEYFLNNQYDLVTVGIESILLIIMGFWYYFRYVEKQGFQKTYASCSFLNIGSVLAIGLLMQFAGTLLLTSILPIFPKQAQEYTEMMSHLNSESQLMVLSVCILAPIVEEITFRGLTFRYYEEVLPFWAAILIQSGVFAVAHGNRVQMIYTFVMGIFIGLIAYWYKSILLGIILHFMINTSSFFIRYLMPDFLGRNVFLRYVAAALAYVLIILIMCFMKKRMEKIESGIIQ